MVIGPEHRPSPEGFPERSTSSDVKSKGLLSSIHPDFAKNPIINKIEGYFFVRKNADKYADKIAEAITSEFTGNVTEKRYSIKQVLVLFLQKKSFADWQAFDKFLDRGGLNYLRIALTTGGSLSAFKTHLNQALKVTKIDPGIIEKGFQKLGTQIGTQFPNMTKQDMQQYLDYVLETASSRGPEVAHQFLDHVEVFLKDAKNPELSPIQVFLSTLNLESHPHLPQFLTRQLEIADTINPQLKTVLENKTVKERELLGLFLAHGGQTYLDLIPENKYLASEIDMILESMQQNPGSVEKGLRLYPTIEQMMSPRYSSLDKYHVLNELIEQVPQKNAEESSSVLDSLESLLREAKDIQIKRPQIFSGKDFPSLFNLQAAMTPYLHEGCPTLRDTISEILDMTVVRNWQRTGDNIGQTFKAISDNNRNIPTLRSRNPNVSFSLYREIRPPFTLEEEPESVNLSSRTTDDALVDYPTMETRTMQLAIPLKETASKTQSTLQLVLLHFLSTTPGEFRKATQENDASGNKLEPKAIHDNIKKAIMVNWKEAAQLEEKDWNTFFQWYEQNSIQKEFLEWAKKAEIENGKLTADFNSTDIRPRFSFARELPEMQRAFANPESQEALIAAASTKNIFNLGGPPKQAGMLSLLPQELDLPHQRAIARLSEEDLQNATRALFDNTTTQLTMPESKSNTNLRKANLNFKMSTRTLENNVTYLICETIIQDEKGSHIRKTWHPIKAGNQRGALEDMVNSGLFHRNLLLAKAEFMQRNLP